MPSIGTWLPPRDLTGCRHARSAALTAHRLKQVTPRAGALRLRHPHRTMWRAGRRPYRGAVALMTSAQRPRRDAAALAEEAYVFAYPLLVMDRAMRPRTANRLVREATMPDTVRMSGWLDLSAEPIVLSAPDMCGRYYALWLRDAWNTLFACAGARATGTEACAFAILGPGRHGAHVPAGMTPIAAPTRVAHVAG